MKTTRAALMVAISKLNKLLCPLWLGAVSSKINAYGFLLPCCQVAMNSLIVI